MKAVISLLCIISIATGLLWLKTPGFLFLLDYITGPTSTPIRIDATGLISGIPFQILAHTLSYILSAETIPKILIIFAIALAGISTAQLCKRISQSDTIAFSCGIFAMLNPFVFNRIFMGHIYLLFGYALIPILLILILRYIESPSTTRALGIGAMTTVIILTSIHYIILLPFILFFFYMQYRQNNSPLITWQHISTLLILPICTCILLLLTALHTPSWTGNTLQKINSSVFSLQPYCSTSVLWDTLTLSANWRSPTINTYPCNITPLIGIASGILILTAVAGVSSYWIAILYIASIALALGISHITTWNPMRDSGKFLAVTVLAQVLLIATAYTNIQTKFHKNIFLLAVLCSSIIIAIATLIAVHTSIIPREYPTSWYEWNEIFAKEQPKPRVLFLPWHQYMAFDFTNHLAVANPAPVFFSNADIISGDNIEISRNNITVLSVSQNPTSQAIEHMLTTNTTNDFMTELQTIVSEQHIAYIVIAKSNENEIALRNNLNNAPFLTQRSLDETLSVWEVKTYE